RSPALPGPVEERCQPEPIFGPQGRTSASCRREDNGVETLVWEVSNFLFFTISAMFGERPRRKPARSSIAGKLSAAVTWPGSWFETIASPYTPPEQAARGEAMSQQQGDLAAVTRHGWLDNP